MKKSLFLLLAGSLWGSLCAAPISIDFTALSDGCSAGLSLSGVAVSGSSSVCAGSRAGQRGIGIQGGGDSVSLDLGETMTFDFGGAATGVMLRIWDVDPPGNVTFGFNAWNGATALGFFSIPSLSVNPTTFDLTSIAGQSFSSFTLSLSASAPVGLQIQSLAARDVASQVPEPATCAGVGLALAALAVLRRKRA